MPKLNVMQITQVRLRPDAGDILTANAHNEVLNWLAQWTPQRTFMAVVTTSEEESLAILRQDLRDKLVPAWLSGKVQPHMFVFQVSSQTTENGRFWMPSELVWGVDHKIPEA
jgi:hypothetical protein